MHITGGTYAGDWILAFTSNFAGTGKPGWFNTQAPVTLFTFESAPGLWQLGESDLVANAYQTAQYAAPPFPTTQTVFSTIGAPGWAGPTSITIDSDPPSPLVIPAYTVQAWRPQ